MKFILLVVFSFHITWAKQILCQGNLQDVGVLVSQNKDLLTLKVHSPLGYDYLPLLEGPIRPSMKNWMNYQFQQLKVLGGDFTVQFSSEKCEWNSNKNSKISLLNCSEAKSSGIKNLQFHTLSISSVLESGLKETTYYRKFRVTASVDGEYGADTFFISLSVPEVGCRERE